MAQAPETILPKERRNRARGKRCRHRTNNRRAVPVVQQRNKDSSLSQRIDSNIYHLRIILKCDRQGTVSAKQRAKLHEELLGEANYGALTMSRCTTLIPGDVYIIRYARIIPHVKNDGRWLHVLQRCKYYQGLGFSCAVFSSQLINITDQRRGYV